VGPKGRHKLISASFATLVPWPGSRPRQSRRPPTPSHHPNPDSEINNDQALLEARPYALLSSGPASSSCGTTPGFPRTPSNFHPVATSCSNGPQPSQATLRTPATCDNCHSRRSPWLPLLPWLLGYTGPTATPRSPTVLTLRGNAPPQSHCRANLPFPATSHLPCCLPLICLCLPLATTVDPTHLALVGSR